MPVSIREMHLLRAPGTQAALLNLFDGFTPTPTPLPPKVTFGQALELSGGEG